MASQIDDLQRQLDEELKAQGADKNNLGSGYIHSGDHEDDVHMTSGSLSGLDEDMQSLLKLVAERIDTVLNNLPPVMDLRRYCSPIRDQGDQNSCTAHAMGAAIELLENTKQEGRKTKQFIVSPAYLYHCSRILSFQSYNKYSTGLLNGSINMENSRSSRFDTGVVLRHVIGAAVSMGAVSEEMCVYDKEISDIVLHPCLYNIGVRHQITHYLRLDQKMTESGHEKSTLRERIKIGLAHRIPILVGYPVYRSCFVESTKSGKHTIPNRGEQSRGGHCVCIVGYDDSIKSKNDDGIESAGCFIFKNSYGTEWGDKGYGYLPYEYFDHEGFSTLTEAWAIIGHARNILSQFDL